MKKVRVVKIDNGLEFSDGTKLYSEHYQDCCESHELSYDNLSMEDFDGVEFDIESDPFFEKVEGYGIELSPLNAHPIRIPGYGWNNGYYGSDLTLVIESEGVRKKYDITGCQEICE